MMTNSNHPAFEGAPTPPTRVACVNGQLLPTDAARIGILDHGLLYGDGLFETIRIVGGRCFQLNEHLARLEEGASRLGIGLPWSRMELADALALTIAANHVNRGAIRLTITRGEGSPVPDPASCEHPAYFITLRAAATPELPGAGIAIRLATGSEHPRLFLPGMKTLCYLPFQTARVSARAKGYDDALLQYRGQAVETAVSNLFLVQNGKVITPSLKSGCLPGIMRAFVLESARNLGIPAREGVVAMKSLYDSAEAFVTNSLQGIVPVSHVGTHRIGEALPGPLTGALQRCLDVELKSFERGVEKTA